MTLTRVWGNEDDANLRKLARSGLSAGQIAVKLERTRNAVCGRAWRLNIHLHGTSEGKPRVQKVKLKPRVMAVKRFVAPSAPLVDPPTNVEARESNPVSLLDLQDGMCKWPVGDFFCGAVALPRRPYCMQHTYVSHHTEQPTKTETTPRLRSIGGGRNW